MIDSWSILVGDALTRLRELPEASVQCCCTSPPYWGLRNYNVAGQLGLEKTPREYVANMAAVFEEVRRVLREDGTCWVNLGDSYTSGGRSNYQPGSSGYGAHQVQDAMARPDTPPGLKPKDMVGIPWTLAFALRDAGWWLRADIPWVKRSAMPESVTDRPTKALEYVFLLTKSSSYFFDMEAVRRPVSEATLSRDQYSRMLENDGPQAVRHDHESTANPAGRSWRNSDPWFESVSPPWGLVGVDDELVGLDVTAEGFKGSHFATFPCRFVQSLLKAGTSERGCCAACGAPWERVVEREINVTGRSQPIAEGGKATGGRDKAKGASCWTAEYACGVNTATTTGWSPGCDCNAETLGCLVLDPFAGAGTTIMVARRLGCRAIGIELNEAYAEMARKRITADAPLFNGA